MCHRRKRDNSTAGKSSSSNIAKERLKIMMDLEKQKLDDDTLNQIRHEIGLVITKYVDIEPENVEVKVMLKDYKSRPRV